MTPWPAPDWSPRAEWPAPGTNQRLVLDLLYWGDDGFHPGSGYESEPQPDDSYWMPMLTHRGAPFASLRDGDDASHPRRLARLWADYHRVYGVGLEARKRGALNVRAQPEGWGKERPPPLQGLFRWVTLPSAVEP